MLLAWTVNYFMSTIKEAHFKTLRANYQIPDYIPIRLPYKSENCYYEGVDDVGVYKQVLKAGLRFPLTLYTTNFLSTWAVRQPNIPECLEGFYSDGGPVRSHVKRCQIVDSTGIPPLLLSR